MAYILSTGSYVPPLCIDNESLTQFPRATIPLIAEKTGVRSRHHVEGAALTSDLCVHAARQCIGRASITPELIDFIIVATSTPDRLIPATASKVAHQIGAVNCFAYDTNSVCSGSVAALQQACSLVDSGMADNVVVISADCYSRILNPKDFSTYPYFGDGAGAALVSSRTSGMQLLNGLFRTDGSAYEAITLKAGAAELPAHSASNLGGLGDCYFKMEGRKVFEFATSKVPQLLEQLLSKYGISKTDIAAVILHQANINIINEIARRTGIDRGIFFTNLERYGNTASASVLIALDEFLTSGHTNLDPGKYIVSASFGGGLSWGGNVIKIALP